MSNTVGLVLAAELRRGPGVERVCLFAMSVIEEGPGEMAAVGHRCLQRRVAAGVILARRDEVGRHACFLREPALRY